MTLEELVTRLRALGVVEYRGPIPELGEIELKLGPLPPAPEPAPAPQTAPSLEDRWAAVEKRLFPEG